MIDWIVKWDKEFFLYINSKHLAWLDPIMLAFSSYQMWTIVFLLALSFIYFRQPKYKIISSLWCGATVLASTFFANLIKIIVQRPRPIHELDWLDIIHNIESYSSTTSFFSSHAATTFCVATFVFSLLQNDRKYTLLAFVWAALVSYSRIYVAKHYPFDVFVGILMGMLVGYMGCRLLNLWIERKELRQLED